MNYAWEIAEKVRNGEVSAVDVATTYLRKAEAHNPELNAFLSFFDVIEQAKRIDEKRARGEKLGALAGVPIGVKDNMQITGKTMTCGSRFLETYTSPYTAAAIQNLIDQDALILGKTNLDEFAMGSSNEHSSFGTVSNPWDTSRVPGGSSGGSATAVAARLVPIALGSDTGGSIRQPASFTGTIGFKPTYGRVSRYGLVAFGSSFDVIGPFANSVKDIAFIMETLAKPDPKDATSLQTPPDHYLDQIEQSIQNKVIGVPWHMLKQYDESLLPLFETALNTYTQLGCTVKDISLPSQEHAISSYYVLSTAEASTNLARFDGIRYGLRSKEAKTLDEVYELSKEAGFGDEVKQRILLGTFVVSSEHKDEYFVQAQKVRTLITREFEAAFSECDVIATPTTPNTAFVKGAIADPLSMYLQDLFTVSANLVGIPAISVPSGHSSEGLPIGIHLVGPKSGDASLLQIAHQYEISRTFSPALPSAYA